MPTLNVRRSRVVLFFTLFWFTPTAQIAVGQATQQSKVVYVLRPHDKSVALPEKLNGLPVKIIEAMPEPPSAAPPPISFDELRAQLTPAPALQMTAADRKLLLGMMPRLARKPVPAQASTTSDCNNHQVIGTEFPPPGGSPLQTTDTVGTWVSMPIAENGIAGLDGTLFQTFANEAAETLEVIGNYCNGAGCAPNTSLLSVFDWSCVDNKEGDPSLATCAAKNDFMYGKAQADIPSAYKFFYWDCCEWKQAFALANKSVFVRVSGKLPPIFGVPERGVVYANEAKILNWDTLQWETFYSRIFLNRDAQPPRPFGLIASLEFVATPCPAIPRLGYREIRFLPPGGVWTLATPDNTIMRFDLPNDYRYCLFDPNDTWCACLK
jgi:hypothetical protein